PQSTQLICLTGWSANSLSSGLCKNISLRRSVETVLLIPPSRPERGAFRDRHERGTGCGGRGGVADERHSSGRRSRVVLTPRRWRQVCKTICKRRWQESPITGES